MFFPQKEIVYFAQFKLVMWITMKLKLERESDLLFEEFYQKMFKEVLFFLIV